MLRNRKPNNKMNKLHEKALRIFNQDDTSIFEE